ncbi:hypothetical protein BD311DRAFT_766803 [Dichomitus squalens]|uniref:Beta-lactamase-like protein n=1 Tax=Dichomitus squalens TaxID=114155 RepID=A0A4Q9MAY2_9APHY|nr:hypothetical protein BD311DRAFT_766803 [Dichomitus squalens]
MSASHCVIREVTKDVWTFSCPFSVMNIFPVGGRSTAIKLRDGDVWILASTPLNGPTKAKIKELGPVRWIIGADMYHHLFLPEYKKEFPEARVIAVEAAKARKEVVASGLKFDGAWGEDPAHTTYGFEDDIEHCYFSGFHNKDVAFLHKPSRTLIQADLLFNFPAREQYSLAGGTPFFSWSSWNPFSWANRKTVWWLGQDKEAMRRDAKTVAQWDFDRIIPCHGDVIETGGKKAWTEAYKDFLG